ncbi:hypothetical protein EVAR_83528_1 [Eumeta japonica]|uniref:Uncharacterized protein n=1 Tax=Eumeta variegata TaxID=151549 RepID=A0A4C1ZHA4_EUMVA|nr:hypothetical protein EVAR_83528_1 [Eumeta japonica]
MSAEASPAISRNILLSLNRVNEPAPRRPPERKIRPTVGKFRGDNYAESRPSEPEADKKCVQCPSIRSNQYSVRWMKIRSGRTDSRVSGGLHIGSGATGRRGHRCGFIRER